jgi:hypothetical protein
VCTGLNVSPGPTNWPRSGLALAWSPSQWASTHVWLRWLLGCSERHAGPNFGHMWLICSLKSLFPCLLGRKAPEVPEAHPDEWLVDAILGHRTRAGKLEFLVRWKDWDPSDTRWEPWDIFFPGYQWRGGGTIVSGTRCRCDIATCGGPG